MDPENKLFSYILPREKIAQRPVYPYDSARLLVLNRHNSGIKESTFLNITDFLKPADLLIFNNSRVIPARLFASTIPSLAKVELLLLEQTDENAWLALGKPLKKIKQATKLKFSENLFANVKPAPDHKKVSLEFEALYSDKSTRTLLFELGYMPIPPYIRQGLSDSQDTIDYQSLFAVHEGSVAAPTASLHFTERLLDNLSTIGIGHSCLTLHVGTASFLPIYVPGSTELNRPETERFQMSAECSEAISKCRAANGRIIAVGTTTVRALESWAIGRAEHTDLFIQPGFEFKVCDAIITNFHQPATTHLALVEAFIGRERLSAGYQYALEHDFRFLSYGDGMLLL